LYIVAVWIMFNICSLLVVKQNNRKLITMLTKICCQTDIG